MEELKTINGAFLKDAFKKATENLINHKDEINALNVFPVPDGDTGSNMTACMMEACKELDRVQFESVKNVADAIKTGTLMGARGNSGVILSQIFSGFCEVISKEKQIDLPLFSEALKRANHIAKSAVIKPVRGTILTLIEDISQYMEKNLDQYPHFLPFLEAMNRRSFLVVKRTQEMMPKLKQAGVVDAGAKGLAYIFEGMYRFATGETKVLISADVSLPSQGAIIMEEELTYQYCTEFMLKLFPGVENGYIQNLKASFEDLGDSIVVVHDGNLLRGHIHTDHPGLIVEMSLELGELGMLKVDNMKEQHQNVIMEQESQRKESQPLINPLADERIIATEQETKNLAFVVVSPGEGIAEIFREMNVDQIVNGGQTMNPSTSDIFSAIHNTHARHTIILPNNPNVVLAAESAANMASEEGMSATVLPTHSVQEGIACLIAYVETRSLEENLAAMQEARKEVLSLFVTRAIRDSEIEGSKIVQGDFLFFEGKHLILHNRDLFETVMKGLESCQANDYEVMTLFYGDEVTEDESKRVVEIAKELFPNLEVSLYHGGQPHYPFFISLEK